jgi:hypothetical protein
VFYRSAWCYIPEDSTFHSHCHENLKSNEWFPANNFTSNNDKTNFVKFEIINKSITDLKRRYYGKPVKEAKTTKFLISRLTIN